MIFYSLFVPSAGFAQQRNSIVVTEIMADPSPLVGLPEVEYLEIYNRLQVPRSLKGWKLMLGGRSVNLPDQTIGQNSYVILCAKTNQNLLSGFGEVIGLSSFSLTNSGMLITLIDDKNQIVYSVSYKIDWWAVEKKDGGFALEMIDKDNPCGEENNWQVSDDHSGGTPGRENSVSRSNPDFENPFVERIDVSSSGDLTIVFSEKLDSLNAVSGSVIKLDGVDILMRELISPSFRNLKLFTATPMTGNKLYRLVVSNISDCSGNLLRESVHSISLPVEAETGDILINEILFNPRPGGVDFVELSNVSQKYISLRNWTLGSVKTDLNPVFFVVSLENVIIAPNSFLALTADADELVGQYPTRKPRQILQIDQMPVLSDKEGSVILRNEAKQEMDKFAYSEKMHLEFLTDVQGVSLERISPFNLSSDPSNWHSAAATSGYATPGYANSQTLVAGLENIFSLEPEAFSPDGDGKDDYTAVRYGQKMAGKLASISIYDMSGRKIRKLLVNQLIGTTGEIRWDGSDDSGRLVGTGFYLLLIEVFDVNGNHQQFKRRVVVVRANG